MSAYIVPNETIQIIAAWANRSEQGIVNYAEAEEAAKILFSENARSVAFRYLDSLAAMPLAVTQANWQAICSDFKPELCFAAARGYEYQSCECGDYRQSIASGIVRKAIKNAALVCCENAGVDCWCVDADAMKQHSKRAAFSR